jgi:arylsulfatase A-like enzyme
LVLNNDLAPTLAELAGVGTPEVDGRSLVPLLSGAPGLWRSAALIETKRERRPNGTWGNPPTYQAVRTEDRIYVEYATRERELYDLSADPHQLENLAGTMPEVEAELHSRLESLKGCAAETCRSAEGP